MMQGIEWKYSRAWNVEKKGWDPAKLLSTRCVQAMGSDEVPSADDIKSAIDLDGAIPGGRGGSYYKGNKATNGNVWIKFPPF
jgi:hypothetical protein